MKNVIRLIFLLIMSTALYSQIDIDAIRNTISLKGSVQLPDSTQMKLIIEQLMQLYGKSFKYFDDLKMGNYTFKFSDGKDGKYAIEIKHPDNTFKTINVQKKTSRLGGYTLHVDYKSIEQMLSQFNNIAIKHSGSIVNIKVRNNILVDKKILNYEELQPDEQRILDKEFTTDNFVDQFDNELELYKMCQEGIMFPYSGGHSKFVTIDDQYSSLIYFDEGLSDDDNSPLNRCYGYFGDNNGEFMNPAGICVGRMTTVSNKDIYPLYIADKIGLQISRVNFVVDNNYSTLGLIDTGSFERTGVITYPYDVDYFTNAYDSTGDKLWITQQHPFQNFLTCLNLNGSIVQRFSGYKSYDNGQTFSFGNNSLIRLAIYNNSISCLVFIDKSRNCLISCLLDSNGLASVQTIDERNDYIIANEIIQFPYGYDINSVQFHKTPLASNLWPSLWVTSPSYIHHLKINANGNIQYLASSYLPDNSLETFTNLRNVICTNEIYDIFTIEDWSMTRGIRKFYPFCDIHSETLENYCIDSVDVMRFKATFTNDCWLYLTAQRKNRSGNWETVKIKKMNGTVVNEYHVIKWQFAGWNQGDDGLYIDLELDLPIEDYVLGDSVMLSMQMYPEYSNPTFYYNDEHVKKYFKAFVQKTCLPKSGGCPFIYVINEQEDFEADNNIFHRMEFSEPGTDITDVYKLRVTPKIFNNSFDIYLVENENDSAYIDI